MTLETLANDTSTLTIFCIVVLCIVSNDTVHSSGPQFIQSIQNKTVIQGEDVKMVCKVQDIGKHKVAWFHVEKKQVLAVHTEIVTRNHRIKSTNEEPQIWILHIQSVRRSDSGHYMCQINTVPMRQQFGYLDVVVSPSIIPEESSSDLSRTESTEVKLKCKATGSPEPVITWKRDDGSSIPITDENDVKHLVHEHRNEILHIKRLSRLHMGAYMCSAKNGVNPPATRRILLNVNFPPMLWIPEQLIGAVIDSKIKLVCNVEAFPKPITYWKNTSNNVVISSDRYLSTVTETTYKTQMKLTILKVSSHDFGRFKCISKNPLGETEGVVKIYEKERPSTEANLNRNDESIPDLPRNSPVMKNLVGKETKSKEETNNSGKENKVDGESTDSVSDSNHSNGKSNIYKSSNSQHISHMLITIVLTLCLFASY